MPQFEPYYMIARRLAKEKFDRQDLMIVTTFMTEDIERLIGPRLSDRVYHFEGIYFKSTHPQMEYSQQGARHLTKIRLASGSSKDPGSAIWQLAHECVHLITPSRGGSTVLEEGVACWYQERWVDKIPQVFPDWIKTRRSEGYFPSYDEAYALVDALMTKDPDIMKRVRRTEPVISKITADLLKQEAPWLNKAIAKKLTARFRRGRPRRRTRQASSAVSSEVSPKIEPIESIEPMPLLFDPRASEISRQAARLHIGMELLPERLARLNIAFEEVYEAFVQTYGKKVLSFRS